MERCDQVEGELLTPVYFDLPRTPVNDPVCQDPTTRVQLEFCLTIPSLIETPRREDLHHQFRRGMQMPVRSQGRGAPVVANPYHVRSHIVIIGKDHARCEIGLTSPG